MDSREEIILIAFRTKINKTTIKEKKTEEKKKRTEETKETDDSIYK